MRPYEELTDEELIQMLHGHQEDSDGMMEYIMEKYKNLVRGKARAMFLIGGDTDDLIQEGMIGLFKAIRDFKQDKDASFFTFANLCIERQMYNAVNNSNRMKHQPLNTYVSMSTQEWDGVSQVYGEDPENIVIDQENVQNLKEEIRSKLSMFEFEVLEYYVKGKDYLEIAAIMGKSGKSIDNALQRIRTKLKPQKT
ncbi:MAG: sigma-70 family RNA polymerase sigma factor [Lachnospiraceae bacterium]|nr:sigma-70 family RNA polymerase sigma factor [Lachnospiraceae bacterium]MDD3617605.1 sigma-70 family RNA polymerase sigma factor [Lachnospiraceae bacterium]